MRGGSVIGAAALVVSALACGGCREQAGDDAAVDGAMGAGGGPDGGGAMGAGGVGGVGPGGLGAGGAGAGGLGEGGLAAGGGSGGVPNEPPYDDTCYIDNFCPFVSVCELGHDPTVLECFLTDCDAGYDNPCRMPCSGASHEFFERACGGDSVCVPRYAEYDPRFSDPVSVGARNWEAAECWSIDAVCGGPEARRCPEGTVCEALPHAGTNGCDYLARGGFGRCVALPDCAVETPLAEAGLCACDGQAYPSVCAAAAAGVAVEPSRDPWERGEVPASRCEALDAAAGVPGARLTAPSVPGCAYASDCACDHACVEGVCVRKADPFECAPDGDTPSCYPGTCGGVTLTGVCLPPPPEAPAGTPGRCERADE